MNWSRAILPRWLICKALNFRLRTPPRLRNQRGQSVVEYILMMFLIVSIVIFIFGSMKKSSFFFKRFTEPLVKHIVYNYKYGDSSAQGWDEGSPRKHIQISQPNGNATFRLFQPEKN